MIEIVALSALVVAMLTCGAITWKALNLIERLSVLLKSTSPAEALEFTEAFQAEDLPTQPTADSPPLYFATMSHGLVASDKYERL